MKTFVMNMSVYFKRKLRMSVLKGTVSVTVLVEICPMKLCQF